jgi:hypothetical protein
MKIRIFKIEVPGHLPRGYWAGFELGGKPIVLGPYSTTRNAKRGFKRYVGRVMDDLAVVGPALWRVDVQYEVEP